MKERSALRLPWGSTDIAKEWLPLPEEKRNRLSLEHHLQLEVVRAGAGTLMSLKLLMRVALASLLLQQLGYAKPLPRSVEDYETAARKILHGGRKSYVAAW